MKTEQLNLSLLEIVNRADELSDKVSKLNQSQVDSLLKQICGSINEAHEFCKTNSEEIWQETQNNRLLV